MKSRRAYLTGEVRLIVTAILILTFSLGLGEVSGLAQRSKPYSLAAPIRLDFDMESIPEPREVETGYLYDWADGTLFQQIKQGFDVPRHVRHIGARKKEALNVNTMDEVPDSSWFTNRAGRRGLSVEEIKRGPGVTGPAPGELTVIRAKTIGKAPGFWVRDGAGQVSLNSTRPTIPS